MRKKMTKSYVFGGLFLSSHVLKGTFASIYVNCQAASFSLHAGDYSKLKISVAIPK